MRPLPPEGTPPAGDVPRIDLTEGPEELIAEEVGELLGKFPRLPVDGEIGLVADFQGGARGVYTVPSFSRFVQGLRSPPPKRLEAGQTPDPRSKYLTKLSKLRGSVLPMLVRLAWWPGRRSDGADGYQPGEPAQAPVQLQGDAIRWIEWEITDDDEPGEEGEDD